jgi:hypothetical protein
MPLITSNIPIGLYRKIAFACFDAGQSFCSRVGLVLPWLFINSWRYGWILYQCNSDLHHICRLDTQPPLRQWSRRPVVSNHSSPLEEGDRLARLCPAESCLAYSPRVRSTFWLQIQFPNPASLSLFSIAAIVVPFIGIFEGRSAWVEKQSFHHPLWSRRLFQFLLIAGLLTIYEFMQFFLVFFSQSAQHMSLVETSIRICQ